MFNSQVPCTPLRPRAAQTARPFSTSDLQSYRDSTMSGGGMELDLDDDEELGSVMMERNNSLDSTERGGARSTPGAMLCTPEGSPRELTVPPAPGRSPTKPGRRRSSNVNVGSMDYSLFQGRSIMGEIRPRAFGHSRGAHANALETLSVLGSLKDVDMLRSLPLEPSAHFDSPGLGLQQDHSSSSNTPVIAGHLQGPSPEADAHRFIPRSIFTPASYQVPSTQSTSRIQSSLYTPFDGWPNMISQMDHCMHVAKDRVAMRSFSEAGPSRHASGCLETLVEVPQNLKRKCSATDFDFDTNEQSEIAQYPARELDMSASHIGMNGTWVQRATLGTPIETSASADHRAIASIPKRPRFARGLQYQRSDPRAAGSDDMDLQQ